MKRAIVIASDYRLMSALVSRDTVTVIKEGDRVTVTHSLELGDFGAVPSGEAGTVVYVDRKDSGHIEIIFDHYVPALHEWRNVLLVAPFDSADLIEGLALETCLEAKEIDAPSVAAASRAPLVAS